jgi:hypothetical protein
MSRRAAARFFEAIAEDADLLCRVALLLSDLEKWMDSVSSSNRNVFQPLDLLSDVVSQELLDTRHVSDEIANYIRIAGQDVIVQSLSAALQLVADPGLVGCVSHELLQPHDRSKKHIFAYEVLSGHDLSMTSKLNFA